MKFDYRPLGGRDFGSQLVEQAYRSSSILWNDPEVVEFAHPGEAGAWSAGPIRLER